jgi:catechol 2,3-dioxygenase
MPVKLEGIGHCAIIVKDVEAMSSFYQQVLGFDILERDPAHGGVFMQLAGTSHLIDLFPADMVGGTPSAGGSPLLHIGFRVASYQRLREAHDALLENDVKIRAMLDHTNQRSVYFADPEGNRLEIYFEKPDWAEIFARGRGDEDQSFSFDEPAPTWE